ncbi:MAG: DUF6152 family protein [Acidobacteria bacterium]|nr:DUF6152 family protein [Acidobacteriota bacterium]
MRGWTLGVAAALILGGASTQAHHSVAGAYDDTQEATIDGVITGFRFVNPHPFVTVTRASDGESWRLDMDNRREFDAIGFAADDLSLGDRVVVDGILARRDANRLYVMRLERPADGFGFEQIANRPQLLGPRSGIDR